MAIKEYNAKDVRISFAPRYPRAPRCPKFREKLLPRYMEAGREEKRAIIREVLRRMVEHEIMEGITAEDGSRPFDPHRPAYSAMLRIPFKEGADLFDALRKSLEASDPSKATGPDLERIASLADMKVSEEAIRALLEPPKDEPEDK